MSDHVKTGPVFDCTDVFASTLYIPTNYFSGSPFKATNVPALITEVFDRAFRRCNIQETIKVIYINDTTVKNE